MKKYLVSVLMLSFILLISCSKEDDTVSEPELERFQLNFQVKNGGNLALPLMYMDGNVLFPIEEISYILSTNSVDLEEGQAQIVSFDGQSDQPMVYEGCRQTLTVEFREKVGESKYYVSTWKTKMDTIKGKEMIDIVFTWPNDTLTAQKMGGVYLNSLWEEKIKFH